eukprot:CAMPEP_0118944472 /NCGR_PEP_ID=MMETSP1169-20130426/40372_1 /TAXON_ID=36882 /ORGANISM="Pyramimonas obovata, Strain CCMP722" /LENGTH=353 /DNA_ID=CAMNT_0006889969 /DNA_START=20 /DNA_END=1077 /DNA_ORIENTATION=-
MYVNSFSLFRRWPCVNLLTYRTVASYVATHNPLEHSTQLLPPSLPQANGGFGAVLSRVTGIQQTARCTNGHTGEANFYIGGWGTQRLMSSFSRRSQRVAKKRRSTVVREDDEVVQDTESILVRRAEDAPPVPLPQGNFEDSLGPVLGRPALCVTREIEWGTVIIGFEQANKYAIRDLEGNIIAYMAEDTASLGTAVARQLLKKRRSFVATLFDTSGQVIMRVRRPMYLINSSIHVEDPQGAVVGEVFQRWHLLQRNYDLYLEQSQFAKINAQFLAWDFELLDEQGGPLARVDRNFSGWGKELFTDAGQYALYFGRHAPLASARALSTGQQPALVTHDQPHVHPAELQRKMLDT